MTQEYIKQTIREKLKDCDKEVLIDIIAEMCSIYIKARVFSDMSSANHITQRINTNFKNGK